MHSGLKDNHKPLSTEADEIRAVARIQNKTRQISGAEGASR